MSPTVEHYVRCSVTCGDWIEVHAVDGSWTQTYQPYGIPRNS